MKIAHLGQFTDDSVNGVCTAGYELTVAQEKIGEEVMVYGFGSHKTRTQPRARLTNDFFVRGRNPFRLPRALKDSVLNSRPDIFHLHSVFTPANWAAALFLKRHRIPYVITPHGGYNGNVFAKGRLKKSAYWYLFERYYLQNASGVVCLLPREVDDVRKAGFRGPVVVAPNCLNTESCVLSRRSPGDYALFMGRWDIHGKGLDRLIILFRLMETIAPELELRMHGDGAGVDQLNSMAREHGVRNLEVLPPVFGSEKHAVLSNAAIYLQFSRWEVFGISITEAMCAGVPVAISRDCYIADIIEQVGCGLVLDQYTSKQAAEVASLMTDRDRNMEAGAKGAEYAKRAFEPSAVARRICGFYREVIPKT